MALQDTATLGEAGTFAKSADWSKNQKKPDQGSDVTSHAINPDDFGERKGVQREPAST